MSAPAVEGYRHEVGLYSSDAEFADHVVPFAEEGRDLGEPVIFAYDDYKTGLLQSWLGPSSAFTYVTDRAPYATPAKALNGWRNRVLARLDAGATRIRIAGNVPHPGYGVSYYGWDRYEAALDRALGDLPVWAPCLYDVRITPDEVLHEAMSLHRSIRASDGTQRANEAYCERTLLADFVTAPPDPLERLTPQLDLTDPTPAEVRAGIRRLPPGRLGDDAIDALILAASEAATNAVLHGRAPVNVSGWAENQRMVIRIDDTGSGPTNPLAGLLRTAGPEATSGRGLWIAHQLDLDVSMTVHDGGFTIRLAVNAD